MKIKFEQGIITKKQGAFIDRDNERKFFWDKYDELCEVSDEWPVTVINYHGMGGIGKSQILKKLMLEAEEKTGEVSEKIPTVYIALSEQDTPIKVMNKMITILKRENFIFPLYEVALLELSRVSGTSSIKKAVESIEENSVLISALLDLSAVKPKTTIAGAVFRFADKIIKGGREYLNEKKEQINSIEKMLPEEIEMNLPSYFVQDLRWNIENFTFTYPVIIFLDKMEVLRRKITGIDEVDMQINWLKEDIIGQCPKVVWVCSSREKLEWDKDDEWKDSINNIKINAFDKKWMLEYFRVNETDIETFEDELYDITKGVPLFLNICYELYQELQQKGEQIDFSKFQGKQEKLLQTYIENLSEAETYVLFSLSCIGEWNQEFIEFVAEKSKRNDFIEAYNVLKRKSYIEESDEHIELHQVICEQIFSFCSDTVLQTMAEILYEYMPKERFSWYYAKYLKCKISMIKDEKELENWWIQPDLQLLKDLILGTNMNGFEACYDVLINYTKGRFDDSAMHIMLSVAHIRNLIKFKCYKQAQKEANYMLKACKMSEKYKYIEFYNLTCEFLELKAQALDGQKKYGIALNIRKELCDNPFDCGEASKISRLHNLATSYQSLEQYSDALETLNKVISYREKHKEENPDDYIRALALRIQIFMQYYQSNREETGAWQMAIQYCEEAYREATSFFDSSSLFCIEIARTYARLLIEAREWKDALTILERVHNALIEINQGRNAYIDEVTFMLATALTETGNAQKAFELFESLEGNAKDYPEGSEIFVLRCQLEKGISLSAGGRHADAKESLAVAYDKAKNTLGLKEKLVIELGYAIAVEEYFLHNYDEGIERLTEILPYAAIYLNDNDIVIYMIKNLLIKCKEEKSNV